jgi:hypothetical protein
LSETFQELYGFLGPQPATLAPRLDGVPEPEPLLRVSHVREVVPGSTAVDTTQLVHRVPDKRHTLSQRAVNSEAGKPSMSSSLMPWKSASRTGSRGAALPKGSSRAAAYPKLHMPSTSRAALSALSRAAAGSPSSSAPCPVGCSARRSRGYPRPRKPDRPGNPRTSQGRKRGWDREILPPPDRSAGSRSITPA